MSSVAGVPVGWKSRQKKPAVVRAYSLENRGNAGKLAAVGAVLREFQAATKVIEARQMRAFVQTGEKFWNRRELGQIETQLSARYQRSVQSQVVAGLDSWLALSKLTIRQMIGHSSLPDELKADLWWLNKCGSHYQTSAETLVPVWGYRKDGTRFATKERRAAPPETLALLRLMMKQVRKHRVRVPRLDRARTMALDGTVAQVERSRGVGADLWVRISTLKSGHPVWIPLQANRFFNEAAGELSNFAQVTVSRDKSVKITLVKRSHPAAARNQGIDLALDWGLKSIFATDLGDQLGQSLYPWLCHIDGQLTKLTAELQRHKIKPNQSRRYRRFNQRIRDHVRNEVGRVINQLISVYGPRSLTVERLDFRDGGMSKQMNRLLTRAGRKAVQEKLAAVSETMGISIHEVNPAYSSQECSGCGFVDSRNRSDQHFQCGFCSKNLNSDTNGARIISARRSSAGCELTSARSTVLRRLDAHFEAIWGLAPGSAEKLRRRPKERPKRPRPITDGLAGATAVLRTKIHQVHPSVGMNFYGNRDCG